MYMLEERSLTGVEDVSIAFSSKLIGKRNNDEGCYNQ